MCDPILAGFPVQGVLVAPRTILLHLETIGIVGLVLVGGVVASLALGARESNHCAHRSSYRQPQTNYSSVTRWETLANWLGRCQGRQRHNARANISHTTYGRINPKGQRISSYANPKFLDCLC